MSAPSRRAMLDRANSKLSPRWQCALLDLARSSVYRTRKPAMPSWCAEVLTILPSLSWLLAQPSFNRSFALKEIRPASSVRPPCAARIARPRSAPPRRSWPSWRPRPSPALSRSAGENAALPFGGPFGARAGVPHEGGRSEGEELAEPPLALPAQALIRCCCSWPGHFSARAG